MSRLTVSDTQELTRTCPSLTPFKTFSYGYFAYFAYYYFKGYPTLKRTLLDGHMT